MQTIKKIIYLTVYQMRSRYRKTFAGFIWVVSSPILTFFVQSIIFRAIFKFNVEQYPLYLMSGLMPWFFISQTLYSSTTCLVASREILLAFKIEPFVIVAANVLDQFISFIVAFAIVAGFVVLPIITSYTFLQILTILINFIMIFYFVLMFNFLLAFWYAFYRDINYITNFLLGLMFYITPIFFEENLFPRSYHWILQMNIFIPFVKTFQISLHSWNGMIWGKELVKSILINIILTLLVKWSLKSRLKDFYVSV